jgi:hypothetical protein
MSTEYKSLREKIAAESHARACFATRNETFTATWRDANLAAHVAVQALDVKPMTVIGHNPATGDRIAYHVPDGVCGFAYVTIRPATSAFVQWLKGRGIGHKAYRGGWEISIPHYSQSMQRKEEHARVVSEYLITHGIAAGYYSRMD